jgi:hypothetical protein
VPSSGTQVHDNNGGILPSGLFWTVPLPNDAFQMNEDGTAAHLHAKNVRTIDQFAFGGPISIPSTVSINARWRATGPRVRRGKGETVPPTDPAALLADLAFARSTASVAGAEFGFRFRSNPGVSTDRGFAEMGSERNGAFL